MTGAREEAGPYPNRVKYETKRSKANVTTTAECGGYYSEVLIKITKNYLYFTAATHVIHYTYPINLDTIMTIT